MIKEIGILLIATLAIAAWGQTGTPMKEVDSVYPDVLALYIDIHQNPELSAQETQTASKIATHLRTSGWSVTEHVGGTGVVAVLKNGTGPTVMLRTELDALPVEERLFADLSTRI